MSAVPALAVRELRKSYGEVAAVAGISFTVEQGEVFGLLGPNGAGKTTTVEILEGYRTRDGGDVTVLGVDPEHGGSALRERIGVVLQASDLPAALTVREVHRMFAGYYDAAARRRRGDRARRARGEVGRAREDAVGRAEAPPRPRRRARRRPRAPLPRRADDRLRPRRPPNGVGARPLAARARQDDSPDDALPRRGAAARRPRGRDPRRADRQAGLAGGADRRRRRRSRSATARAAARSWSRPTSRPACSRS